MTEEEKYRRYKNFIDIVNTHKQSINQAEEKYISTNIALFTTIFGTLAFLGFQQSSLNSQLTMFPVKYYYATSLVISLIIVLLSVAINYVKLLVEHSALRSKSTENEVKRYLEGSSNQFKFLSNKRLVKIQRFLPHSLFVLISADLICIFLTAVSLI